ncbi:MAG TPA: RdgB/HAM1 family non-canonical purine NTP pyrophosphatase [Actinomycetota bacterium]|nr:RdgB/HAM1 family non-canonical purine NTP pyrophosphatase [Actinomycetota bacterium]
MALPARLTLATRNPGKIREILEICADWPVRWALEEAPAPYVEETGETYLENARAKAHAAATLWDLPALADDSGIEVDALGGAPGVHSAVFAGPDASDQENLDLLIGRIRSVPESERTARYRCIAVCAWPDGRERWTEATSEGRLILEPRGSGGFGYDPIFVPEGERVTMAELPADRKNGISHRGRAFRALRRVLEE